MPPQLSTHGETTLEFSPEAMLIIACKSSERRIAMPKCKWDKERKTWVMQAYKNKKRKVFYSTTKGQAGKQEIMRAYYEWLDGLEAPNRRTVKEA